MTTEIVSRKTDEPLVIEAGFFYNISKEGNVVRFKPGRKKKETADVNQIEAVEAKVSEEAA